MASADDFASDDLNSGDDDTREVCRDFMRNSCIKGEKCRYKHPTKDLVSLLEEKSVCRDFQNKGCNRPACRYIHVTNDEEKFIRETGKAPSSMEPNRRHTLSGDVPMCGDYMKGRCNRGERCKFRHGDGPRSHDALNSRYDPYSRGGPRDREPRAPPRSAYNDSAMIEEELMVVKEQMIRLRRQVVELTMTNDDLLTENAKLKLMVSNSGASNVGARFGVEPAQYSTYKPDRTSSYGSYSGGASMAQRPQAVAPPNPPSYY